MSGQGEGHPMFVNKMPRYEILSQDAMDTLDRSPVQLGSVGARGMSTPQVLAWVKDNATLYWVGSVKYPAEFSILATGKARATVYEYSS